MKQQGHLFTSSAHVFACAFACLCLFTACSDDGNDRSTTDPTIQQQLDQAIPGDYFDVSYADDGVFVDYFFNSDHTFTFTFACLNIDVDGWKYDDTQGYWYQVATGSRNTILNADIDSLEVYTNQQLNAFDDVFVDEVEGTWRPYVGPLNGQQVTAVIYEVKDDIDGGIFCDTLQIVNQDGETFLLADMSFMGSIIMADASAIEKQGGKVFGTNPHGLMTRGLGDLFASARDKLAALGRAIGHRAEQLGREIGMTFSGEARKNGKTLGNQQLGDWMSRISDDTRLCKMSIPGTHDSWCYGDVPMSGWARTQSLNIQGQWNAGVRCFDVRFNSNDMVVCHGPVKMHHTVQTAFETFQRLLVQHPRETVVLIISIDNGETANWRKLHIYNTFLSVFSGRVATWTPGLTMGESRGKAVCIDRMNLVNCTDTNGQTIAYLGATANGWSTNRDASRLMAKDSVETFLWVQDDYCCDTYESTSSFLARKKNSFLTNLLRMQGSPQAENLWTFNHESGYTGPAISMSYPECSHTMAPYIEGLLREPRFRGVPSGFIMMDYAGQNYGGRGFISYTSNLAETIVNHNF